MLVEKPALEEGSASGEAETGRRGASFDDGDGSRVEVPVLDRGRMGRGSEVSGPTIVELGETTCVVKPGWRGRVDGVGTLVLERG